MQIIISNIEQGIMNYEVKKIKIEVKILLFDIRCSLFYIYK